MNVIVEQLNNNFNDDNNYYNEMNNQLNNIINNNNINNNYDNVLNDNRLRELIFEVIQNNVNNQMNDLAQAAHDAAEALPPVVEQGAAAAEEPEYEDVTEDRQLNKCSICLENNVAVIFNCGHVCSCHSCSRRIDECPICRAVITRRQRMFFS